MNKKSQNNCATVLVINNILDLNINQENIINQLIEIFAKGLTDNKRGELKVAFNYSINYVLEQKKLYSSNEINDINLFIATLSDALNISEKSLFSAFNKILNIRDIDVNFNDNLVLSANKEIKYSKKLAEILRNYLPDYNYSTEKYKHPVFRRQTISCYPKEKDITKKSNDLYAFFVRNPPEKSKYSRPILEIEILNRCIKILCVRCYLTLTDRPREGLNDKDIIQEKNGEIKFQNVGLINFGDPLRALTWVEDYMKNPEHKTSSTHKPIIRSFLISLEDYYELIASNKITIVDADRAPGQVKASLHNGSKTIEFRAIAGSLVSFMNRKNRQVGDGRVVSLHKLMHSLTGSYMSPIGFAEGSSIGHQYGREHYDVGVDEVIKLRSLDRELSGFAPLANSYNRS